MLIHRWQFDIVVLLFEVLEYPIAAVLRAVVGTPETFPDTVGQRARCLRGLSAYGVWHRSGPFPVRWHRMEIVLVFQGLWVAMNLLDVFDGADTDLQIADMGIAMITTPHASVVR